MTFSITLRRLLPALAAATFAAATLAAALPAAAQTLNAEQARAAVAPFYNLLNQPATKDVKALGEAIIAPQWRSFAGEGNFKGRDDFLAQVAGFGKLIPDLKWEIKDVLVDGNRVIVRGEASGTPAGAFFGVPHGGKSFRIMSIDIHTVENGKLVTAHHVEDWAGAIRQLSAR